ncbi:PAS domain-containing sensor histidine kinase [Pararhodospirillum oryzae]|uniref:histidine kinase n=1 Tax=Pararhodospirillum oryzae TaxID=478448 RepID=A0A512HA60_9PROT|nr:PAS domain-containing protein [Pararhodospirillum oryzae]GEO82341.1 hypothetical protein ROR02_24720 [Pararhodospirillum oryzae]
MKTAAPASPGPARDLGPEGWVSRLARRIRRTQGAPVLLTVTVGVLFAMGWSVVENRRAVLNQAAERLNLETQAQAVHLETLLSTGLGRLGAGLAAEVARIRRTGPAPPLDQALDMALLHAPGVTGVTVRDGSSTVIVDWRRAFPVPGTAPVALPPLAWEPGPGKGELISDIPSGGHSTTLSLVVDAKRVLGTVVGETRPPTSCVGLYAGVHEVVHLGFCPAQILTAWSGRAGASGGVWMDQNWIFAVYPVGGTGLVLAAGIPEEPLLAHWRRDSTLVGVLGVILAAGMGITLLTMLSQTARVLASEDALRQRERQLSHALQGSGVGFWEWRPDPAPGLLLLYEGAIAGEHLAWSNFLERVWPQDRIRVRRAFESHLDAPQAPLDVRFRLDLGDARPIWVRLQGRAVETEGGRRPLRLTGLWSDISEQTAADLERRRLAVAMESSPLAVLTSDPRGLVEVASRKIEAMTGLAPELLAGRPLVDLWDDETPASTRAALASALDKGQPWQGEMVSRHPGSDRMIWQRVSLSPIRDTEGGLTGFVSVHEDVTEHHVLQERLELQISTVNAVLDAAPSGILVADTEGRPRLINQRLRWTWGLHPSQIQTDQPWALFSTLAAQVVDPPDFLETVRALSASPGESEVGCDLRLGDGRVIERHSMAIFGDDGVSWGRVWFFTDVTEHKRVERALSDQLEFQHTLVNTLPNPVFYTDRAGRVLGCNRAFADFLGLTPEAVFGLTLEDLFDRPCAEDLGAQDSALMAQGGLRFFEITLTDVHKIARSLAVAKAAFTDAQGQVNGVVGVLTDITDLKRVAEELRRSNQELEQFAYVASHDLQEPLRMVSSYLGLLKRRYGDCLGADADEFIGFAINGAHRMQALIHDLLQFSRIDTRGNPLAPVASAECVRLATENLRIAIDEADAVIETGPLPRVLADGAQLTSLFQNLIGNAIKYRSSERRPHVRVGAEQKGENWEFHVTDNGIGIDPRFAEKVFMIFQRLQTRERYEGTGIGLALAKKIVERHGGRIWLEGAEGVGTTFRFTLPVIVGDEGEGVPGRG